MVTTTRRGVMRALLDAHGRTCADRTHADEAGIPPQDTPQPLYRLLVLACLLSARIRADIAVAAARELAAAGTRDPRRMAQATWQQRVDTLGRSGYPCYDERSATQLGDGATLAVERYGGDLRQLRYQADGDTAAIRQLLQEFPGLGPADAAIFLREVQAAWPGTAPCLYAEALHGARRPRLDLPTAPAPPAGRHGAGRTGRGPGPRRPRQEGPSDRPRSRPRLRAVSAIPDRVVRRADKGRQCVSGPAKSVPRHRPLRDE